MDGRLLSSEIYEIMLYHYYIGRSSSSSSSMMKEVDYFLHGCYAIVAQLAADDSTRAVWRDHLVGQLYLVRGPDAAFQKDCVVVAVYIISRGNMCAYHIGIDGKPWGDEEHAAWRSEVNQVKRSYQDEVVAKLDLLDKNVFEVAQYGSLDYIDGGSEKYKLFYVKSKDWGATKPTISDGGRSRL